MILWTWNPLMKIMIRNRSWGKETIQMKWHENEWILCKYWLQWRFSIIIQRIIKYIHLFHGNTFISWCKRIIWVVCKCQESWRIKFCQTLGFKEFGCLILRVLSAGSHAIVIMGLNPLANSKRTFTFYNTYNSLVFCFKKNS